MNFKELDRLIHSKIKRITLTSDVVLDEGEEIIYKNGIEIDLDGLIIDGNGHTIDARNKARIFNIRAHLQVIITNVVFKNGLHEDGGGAVSNFSKFLTLGYCTFEHNTANEGGAIYNHGFIKATNCNFKYNYSRNCQDIYNWDILILRECSFENKNKNIIFNLGDVKTVECGFEPHHIIENNYKADDSFQKFNDESDEVADNHLESGKANDEYQDFIDNVNDFVDRTVDSIKTSNDVRDEIAEFRKLHMNDRNTVGAMSFCELKDFLSKNNEVFLDGDVVFCPEDEKLRQGIKLVGPDYPQMDESCVVLNHDLVIDGKGHSIDGVGLARIFIILNKDITVTFRDISFKNAYFPKSSGNDYSYDGGGAIYNEGNCRFEFCEFLNNHVSFSGGAVYNYKGTMSFFECIFERNHSEGPAGVIFNNCGDLDFINCIFNYNSSKHAGAVICDFLGNLKFKCSCFKHNSTEFKGIIALGHNVSFDFDGSVFLENAVQEGPYIHTTSFFDVI